MRTASPEYLSPVRELPVRLALLVALVGLLQPGTPPPIMVLAAILVAAMLALSLRWRMGGPAVILLLGVGIALRLAPASGFSDVLAVTEAAIREMIAGGSPYGHGYAESLPVGAPFAYGPLVLVWYLPSLDDPRRLELLTSLLILVLLAIRGKPLGLAVYAVTPALVVSAVDGSNDTSAGLLLLGALLLAVRAPVAGAIALAVAAAFKPYALAWLPALVAYAGAAGPLLAFVAASLVLWLPAVLAWGPESMLWSFRRAEALHERPYYSLAFALGEPAAIPSQAWGALRVGAGVLLAAASLVWVRSAASFVVAGVLVFGATLFLGWWGTFAYLAAIAPILCWHLDGWLGLEGGRVVWPGDPLRAVTTWVDARWPVKRPGRSAMDTLAPAR